MKPSLSRDVAIALLMLAITVLGGSLMATAHAGPRPPSDLAVLHLLNGEPESATQVTTATGSDVTASVTGGKAYTVWCTTDTVYLGGSTVTTSTGALIAATQPIYLLVHPDTTTLAFRARSSAGTCNVSRLK